MTLSNQPIVRSRLAPSPTGHLHLGNAWSFLLCWLAVRSRGGQIVLRMEDIDPDRSRPEFVRSMMDDLGWLGLDWDEGPDCGGVFGPYAQSKRLERYDEIVRQLQDMGAIYPCYCTRRELKSMASAPHAEDASPVYPGTCLHLDAAQRLMRETSGRTFSLRLHGRGEVEFCDLVQGPVRFDWKGCGGDFPVRRSDGVISYQLAVVADDLDHRINLVVRGRDILPSTPRQMRLFELLGAEPPRYAHVPLVLDHQGDRLAKRHKSLELRALRAMGVTPQALVGYLACRAGLLAKAEPVRPNALVSGFSWRKLPVGDVTLEAGIENVLRDLS